MTPTRPPPPPLAADCRVVELRQYTLHPGRRDALIELFDREFVESQEATGMRVLGQFRDLDDADRFVWLRGFAGMAGRAAALQAFYGGPVWAAHRDEANATMVDSDDVRLLRPAWEGAGLPEPSGERAAHGAAGPARGRVQARVLPLPAAPVAELLALCRGPVSQCLREAGAQVVAWYATEDAPNNFPRLPVREGEPVLVALALFDGDCAWPAAADALLQPWLAAPAQALRLSPTTRSTLHAGLSDPRPSPAR